MKKLFVILSLLFCGLKMFSETNFDTIAIEQVSVYSQHPIFKDCSYKTVIDTLVMDYFRTSSLSQLIGSGSNIHIKEYGRGLMSTISFRGTGASHTSVLWNDMNVNSVLNGQVDLSLFPVSFFDEIEIFSGNSSMVNTLGGFGGSINLNNSPYFSTKKQLEASQTLGSFNTYNSALKMSIGNNKFQSASNLFFESSENNYQYVNTASIPFETEYLRHASYRQYGFIQELYHRLTAKDIVSAKLWLQDYNRNLPQLMSFAGANINEYQQNKNLRGVLEYEHFEELSTIRFKSGISSQQNTYFRAYEQLDYVHDSSLCKENSLYNSLNYQWELTKKSNMQTGAEYHYSWVDVFNYPRSEGYKHDREEGVAFGKITTELNSRLTLQFMIKQAVINGNASPLIPHGGMKYRLIRNRNMFLKANIARNYHYPSLNDLYWVPGGNPALKPEYGNSADLSYVVEHKFRSQASMQFLCSGYYTHIRDWILWAPSENGAYYWQVQNLRRVLSRGFESSLKYDYSWSKASLTSSVNYSFTRTSNMEEIKTNDQSVGKQLIYIPLHSFNIFSDFRYKDYRFSWSGAYTGRQYTDLNNSLTNALEPYFINSIALSKKIRSSKFNALLSLRVNNLLNEQYQAVLWRPMPGRHYMFMIKISS